MALHGRSKRKVKISLETSKRTLNLPKTSHRPRLLPALAMMLLVAIAALRLRPLLPPLPVLLLLLRLVAKAPTSKPFIDGSPEEQLRRVRSVVEVAAAGAPSPAALWSHVARPGLRQLSHCRGFTTVNPNPHSFPQSRESPKFVKAQNYASTCLSSPDG